MKKRPDYIDAEYEIVRDARPRPEPWNGVGLPPEAVDWPLWLRLAFQGIVWAMILGFGLFARWFVKNYIQF